MAWKLVGNLVELLVHYLEKQWVISTVYHSAAEKGSKRVDWMAGY